MKNIFVDFSQLSQDSGGYIRYCKVLAKTLNNIQDKKFIFLIPNNYFDEFSKIITNHEIKLVFGSGIILWIKREIFFLNKKLCFFPGNYSTLFTLGKIIFLVIHDLKFKQKPDFLSHKSRLFRSIIVYWSIKSSNKIVSISNFTRLSIEKFYKKKSTAIYTPIKPSFKIKTKKKSNYFLSVLTGHMHKNSRLLQKLFKKLPNEKLILVGDFQSESNNIKVMKNISDETLFNLYYNCKAFIFPSLYEGLGQPVIEASYFKKPIICTNLPPLIEITNNKATYIQNPLNLNEWEKKLKKMKFKSIDYKNDHFFDEIFFLKSINKLINETNYPRPEKR